jgi:AsmA protein
MAVEGRLLAERVRISGLEFEEVRLALETGNGILRADPIHALFYGGRIQGRAGLDATGPTPVSSLVLQAEGFQVGPVFRALTGKEEMTGTARLDLDFRSSGLGPDAWMADLSGPCRFELEDGTVGFLGAPRETGESVENTLNPLETDGPMPYRLLSGSVAASSGRLENRDLLFESPALRATGQGVVDLRKRRMDYVLKASFPVLPGVHLHIAGPLDKPDVSLKPLKRLGESVEGLGRQAGELPGSVGRTVRGVGENVEKLPGGIGGRLKGRFDR